MAYEYAYADNNLPAASRAVSSAISVLLQLHGEAGIAESRVIGKKAVSRGVLNAPLQVPGTLIHGLLPAKAYHDDSKAWQVVRALEEHASEIRNEILAAYRDGKFSNRYEYEVRSPTFHYEVTGERLTLFDRVYRNLKLLR